MLDMSRFVYNCGIEIEKSEYKTTGMFTKQFSLYKKFNEYKVENNIDWLNIPISIQRLTLDKVIRAYERFFSKQTRYPKYKTKKSPKKSFPVRAERIYFDSNSVSIEGMGHHNRIYCGNHKIPATKYYNATITFDGDDFWICLNVKVYNPIEFEPQNEPIGIDLGVKHLAMLSNGKSYKMPNTSKLERRLRRIDKRVSKDMHKRLKLSISTRTKYEDIPKSKNQLKREKKRRKIIRRICNINNSYIHKMTREIINSNPEYIVLEDLRVREMEQLNHFTRADISKARFRTIRNQIEYKARYANIPIYIADKEFPSSQLCSSCGFRQNIGRSRIYRCPICGNIIDRDLNAAINLRDYPKTHRV